MRRVLIVQYAGDYREAVRHFAAGKGETYHSQRYSVESVAGLTSYADEIAVLACQTGEHYEEVLPNGVRAIGGGFKKRIPIRQVLQLVESYRPTDLIVCTPMQELLSWAIKANVRTLGLLADSFRASSPRIWFRHRRLARTLNHPRIEWIANHNVNASRSLRSIGVNPDKTIPWDWVAATTPRHFPPKQLRPSQESYTLMYAGSLSEDKGVGDLLHAVSLLKKRGLSVSVQLAGKGDRERFVRLARDLGIAERTKFLGLVPHEDVVRFMRNSDAVVVPSRRSYPEGLPMTIYEGLCTRTPIVASDHPMFRDKLQNGVSAFIFHSGDARSLAGQVEFLFSNEELYRSLSLNSEAAWSRLQMPVKFGELLKRWILNTGQDREWLRGHCLSSGRYDNL